MGRKKTDYSGQTINNIFLIKRIDDYVSPKGIHIACYNCICFCGKTYNAIWHSIKKGIGCGCKTKEKLHQPCYKTRKDVSGKRFGFCVAIERLSDGKWLCQCDCGNQFVTSLSHLQTGHTKSCGCFRQKNTHDMKVLDISSKRFGLLFVLRETKPQTHPNGKTTSRWLCKCDCGNFTIISGSEIVSGGIKSCGCIGRSYNEFLINNYLTKSGLRFVTEYSFDDLVYVRPLRFDFAILDEKEDLVCLIEIQGKQHFEANARNTHFGELQRTITDDMKRNYCKEHGIKLFEITYLDDVVSSMDTIINELHVNTVLSTHNSVKV